MRILCGRSSGVWVDRSDPPRQLSLPPLRGGDGYRRTCAQFIRLRLAGSAGLLHSEEGTAVGAAGAELHHVPSLEEQTSTTVRGGVGLQRMTDMATV